jgi:type IV fimbrial biogenesis protein FimT
VVSTTDFPTRQQGFTLIELMVTVLVMAILATVSSSVGSSLFRGHRIRNASMEIATSIVLARSEAIKRGKDISITPTVSSDWAQGWRIITLDGVTTIESHEAIGDVVISGGPTSIVFKDTGRLATGAGISSFQIDLSSTNASYRKCIRLDLSGLPRSVDGACS